MGSVWFLLLFMVAVPAGAEELSPIRLGLVVPMAEEAGRVGQSMRRAAEMAAADWIEKLGRKVDLVAGDDQFDPKQAVTAAEKLVQDGVWGVVGHFYSSSSIPASVVYNQAGVPMVTPTSTHPRLTQQGFQNIFRVCGRDDQQAVTAAEFMLARLRSRRIAVVHDRTDYGRALADALVRSVERRGGGRIVTTEMIAQGEKDFSVLATRLKAKVPDTVYFGGIFREAGYLIRQLRQAGLRAVFVSDDGVLDPEFVRIAGEEAAAGTYLTFARDPANLASAQTAIQRFQAQYGPIGPYVLYTYDAVGVLLHAMQVAKPRATTQGELLKVSQTIHATSYQGTLGTLRWDKQGDLAASPYVMYVTKKGGGLQGWFEQFTGLPGEGNSGRQERR
jgi:branched-chain amino acid transport system substrate-binding protein